MNAVRDNVCETLATVFVKEGRFGVDQEKILDAFGLCDAQPEVKEIFMIGYKEVQRKKDYEERLKVKILKLDPEFYENLKKKSTQRDESPLGIKRAKAAEAARLRREREWEERSKKSVEVLNKITQKINTALEFYDNWKLSSGKTLGEATKQDLINEAFANKKSADGHMQNYTFYSKMAELVPEGKTVSESVDLGEAHKLRESVYVNT